MASGEIQGFYKMCTLRVKEGKESEVASAKQVVLDAKEAIKAAVRATNVAYEAARNELYYSEGWEDREEEPLEMNEAIERELDFVYATPGFRETEEAIFTAQRKLEELQKALSEMYEVHIGR